MLKKVKQTGVIVFDVVAISEKDVNWVLAGAIENKQKFLKDLQYFIILPMSMCL